MSRFDVKPDQLRSQGDAYQRMQRRIGDIEDTLKGVRSGLNNDIGRRMGIQDNLGKAIASMEGHAASAGVMRIALEGICDSYINAENAAAGIDVNSQSDTQGNGVTYSSALKELLLELLRSGGFPGSIIGALLNRPGSDASTSDLLKFLFGDVLKTGAKIVESVLTPGSWMDELLESFDLAGEIGKFGGVNGVPIAVVSWVDVLLTSAIEGLENWEDYKAGKISKEELLSGTIAETGLEVLKDWGMRAAGAAICVAAGIAGAPAIGVTVIANVLGWGVDEVCKQLFDGRDFAQVASDALHDFADWAGPHLADAYNSVVDAVGSVADVVTDTVSGWADSFGEWADSFGGWFSSVFG